MRHFQFLTVDAFTEQPLAGNPCAVLFETDPLDDAQMLAIAKEFNLSETAFVRASKIADFGVRYWTPAEEVPLAGHPTIATIQALWSSGRLILTGAHTRIRLELQVGPIEVDIYAHEGRPKQIVMTQKPPKFGAIVPAAEAAAMLGLAPSDLSSSPAQVVSTGTAQLMIPVRDQDALRRLKPDAAAISAMRVKYEFFSVHSFCQPGLTTDAATFARHFACPPDLFEDPFTGSATGGMGAYLWHYERIPSPQFIAEQGHWMNRPGRATVEVVGPKEAIENVRVGGAAVVIMRGSLASPF